MEISYLKDKIIFEKELNSLDKFVIDFTLILDKIGIKYVLVSGYVSILFGRNRSSEDIDMIIEEITFEKFKELWIELENNFECVNTDNLEDAYNIYLNSRHSIRFSRKGEYIPNMEIKFQKIEIEKWVLENRFLVLLNEYGLFISRIELQIPFKLFLGSEKDIEDAKYLFSMFKDKIDMDLLKEFNRKLKIEPLFNKYIR
ncbi:hypothetical protein J4218_03670 [Candidatus Pacearchaeota archaeon]|nr:hypothetical protein [Candidatus Pacearchaeota archaeon]